MCPGTKYTCLRSTWLQAAYYQASVSQKAGLMPRLFVFLQCTCVKPSRPFAEWKSWKLEPIPSLRAAAGQQWYWSLRTWQRARSSDIKTWQFSVPVHFCHLQLKAKLQSGKAGNWSQFQVWPPVTNGQEFLAQSTFKWRQMAPTSLQFNLNIL